MSIPFCEGRSGLLRHGLLSVCAWVLLFCVVFTYGAAPVYDVNLVDIIVENAFGSSLRSHQIQACAAKGGVLVPDVSDAIHMKLLSTMEAVGASSYCGYLGGSTLLSSTDCTTSRATLSCVWHWDQGRYAGAENAYSFYTGNYYPASESGGGLSGAGMISTASGNYWMQQNGEQTFPGNKHERYTMLALPQTYSEAGWMDSGDATFSYGKISTSRYFSMCLVERTTTTPTRPPTSTNNSTQSPGSITDDEFKRKEAVKRKVNMWIGNSIVITLVASLAILIIICKARRNRWCCFADKGSAAAAPITSSELMTPVGSRSAKQPLSTCSRLSSSSSLRSKSSSRCSGRSFHVATVNRNGIGRRSILQDECRDMEDSAEHIDAFSNASSDSSEWRENRSSPAEEVEMLFQRSKLSHVPTESVVVAQPDSNSQARTRKSCSNSSDEDNTDTPPPRLRRTSSVSFIEQGNVERIPTSMRNAVLT